jgi:glucosyl-dolichyl phosphate glucuronosyltransferase
MESEHQRTSRWLTPVSQVPDSNSAAEDVPGQPVNHASDAPGSVSVLIPTKNRPADLERVVKSLFEQSVLPRQVIIVDQSVADESRRAVIGQFDRASSEIQDVVELSYILDPRIPGGGIARNRGMDLADGEIWLFLDDDVILEPDFLEQLLAVYVRYPQAAGVSGVVTNYERPPLGFRLWDWVFARGPFHDDRQPVYWRANRARGGDPVRVTRLGAGLMSFPAQAIRNLRFDENLRGVSDGEDVDFCARMGSDAILVITPCARLVHNRSNLGREQDHWLRRRARAEHYLYHRNWSWGIKNRLCFWWLNAGYALVATSVCLRRGSLEAWRSLLAGIREGTRAARPES